MVDDDGIDEFKGDADRERETRHLMKSDLNQLVVGEVAAINYAMREFGVDMWATVPKAHVIKFSHIAYEIERGYGEKVDALSKRKAEIANAINRYRGTGTDILVKTMPLLCIEVPLLERAPLEVDYAMLERMGPHEMLFGKSFSVGRGVEVERGDFNSPDSPHFLFCGTTGAGKSMLMQMALLSLLLGTSPDEVEVVIVDPKMQDFANWFSDIPHVSRVAVAQDEIADAVEYVHEVMEARREGRSDASKRVVLLADELRSLVSIKGLLEKLSDIGSIGRAINVNLLCGTQHPTKEGGMGGLLKACFPVRMVGRVTPGASAAATNTKDLAAHLLPGKGSFYRLGGAEPLRFQSFYLPDEDIARAKGMIHQRWGKKRTQRAPVGTGGTTSARTGGDQWAPVEGPVGTSGNPPAHRWNDQWPPVAPVPTGQNEQKTPLPAPTGGTHRSSQGNQAMFPVSGRVELADAEAAAVVSMARMEGFQWRGAPSQTKLCEAVYGSKDAARNAEIRRVLTEAGMV